jgi:hypothetical protein
MQRDPRKRVTAFGIGIHRGEVRAVLVLNDSDALIVGSNGMTHHQAEALCDGYVGGLRESANIPEPMILAFLDEAEALARLEVPIDVSPADRELFKQGAIGGLRLATDGYWIDVDIPEGTTIH